MAFRSFVSRVGAGSAATAGATGTAHCYSRPAARPSGSQPRVDESWVLPQVLDNSQILFSEEEINDTVNLFLGGPVGQLKIATTITEVDNSDAGSEGSSANLQMEAADRSLSSSMQLQNGFSQTLTGLLNNAEVQRACVNALKDDPAFSDLLALCPAAASSGTELDLRSLLPPAAQAAEAAGAPDAEDPLRDFIDALGARALGIGEKIKNTWDSVGNAVGHAFVKCGLTIHAMLGRPFQQEPQYQEQSEWRDVPENNSWYRNPDVVGKVVIKVACVVVALMVFKRVYRPM